MTKFRKSILILGILALCIGTVLATFVLLSFFNSIVTEPIAITFNIDDEEKVFDGEPLSAKSFFISDGQLIEGHRVEAVYSGTQTNVGQNFSDMSVKILDEGGYDVTSKYKIKIVGGILTVTRGTLSVKLNSGSAVFYTGKTVVFDDYKVDVLDGELPIGYTVGAKVKGAGIVNADSHLKYSDVEPVVYDQYGNDVSFNYVIEFKNALDRTGTYVTDISVKRRPITIKMRASEKVYDGTSAEPAGYDIIDGTLAEGQILDVLKYTKSDGVTDFEAINPGRTVITAQFRIFAYDDNKKEYDLSDNYEIEIVTAVVVIKKRPITVSVNSVSKEYDGTKLVCNQYTVIEGELIKGHSANAVFECTGGRPAELTQVDKKTVAITDFRIYDGHSAEVTDFYEVDTVDGTLEVTKRNVNVHLINQEKVYDGKRLVYTNYEITQGSLLADDEVELGYTGDLVEVGSLSLSGDKVTVKVNHTVNKSTENVTENYNLYVWGSVTISVRPASLHIITPDVTAEYDGQPHGSTDEKSSSSSKFKFTGLVEDEEISVVYRNKPVNAGSVENSASVTVYRKSNSNLVTTGNYTITYTLGTVTITKKSIEVSVKDGKSKVYDGKPITLRDVKALDLFEATDQQGHTIALDVLDCNLIDVVNVGQYTVEATFLADNYNVGSLKNANKFSITPLTLTVQYAGETSKVYDGQPVSLDYSMFSIAGGGYRVVGAHTTDAVKDAGTHKIGFALDIVTESGALVNADCVTYAQTLDYTIEKRPVTVSSVPIYVSSTISYDAFDSLSASDLEGCITVSGLINGDACIVTVVMCEYSELAFDPYFIYQIQLDDNYTDSFKGLWMYGTLVVL